MAEKAKEAPIRPVRRGIDPELQTMARLDRLLAEHKPEAVDRILTWACGKYMPEKTDPANHLDSN